MPHYRTEVRETAREVLETVRDAVIEAVVNGVGFDRNDVEGLDAAHHETAVDRGYTLADAAWVLAEGENVETDSGLWEGMEPQDAVLAMAAHTFGNDVWATAEGFYGEIKEEVEAAMAFATWSAEGTEADPTRRRIFASEDGSVWSRLDRDGALKAALVMAPDGVRATVAAADAGEVRWTVDPIAVHPALKAVAEKLLAEGDGQVDGEIEKAARRGYAERAFERVQAGEEPEPLAQGSDDERVAIERWLTLKSKAERWGGYPLGECYIDARCGTGYGMPEILDYANFDRSLAKRAPHLRGKDENAVRAYLAETFARDEAISKDEPDFLAELLDRVRAGQTGTVVALLDARIGALSPDAGMKP